jgi:hypothetical protein
MTIETYHNDDLTIEQLAEAVRGWNCDDVHALRELLRALNARLDEARESGDDFRRLDEVIDTTNLPSASLAGFGLDGYTEYPVWACDNSGRCLVGETLDNIEDAAAILAHYEDLEDLT